MASQKEPGHSSSSCGNSNRPHFSVDGFEETAPIAGGPIYKFKGGLITYCVYNGDLDRIRKGYDNYRNICGKQTILDNKKTLTNVEGIDLRMRPYLLVFRPDGRHSFNASYVGAWLFDAAVPKNLSTDVARVCLASCRTYPNYVRFKKRCIPKKMKGVSDRFFGKTGIPNLFVEVAEDLDLCWKTIFYLEVGSAVLAFVIMVSFSVLTVAMVWLVISTALLLCLAFTTYMWVLFVESKQTINQPEYLPSELELERNRTYLAFALIGTFMVPYLVYTILTKRKIMELVIQLYKEVIKPVTAMRFLLLQPVLTCTFVSATILGWIYATLWIECSGNEKRIRPDYLIYVKDYWNASARWYNSIASLWMVIFFLDCQHMVVAGAVSLWYFCGKKHKLRIPILYGFFNLVVYHLGSVSLGSLITILSAIPRTSFKLTQTLFKAKEEEFNPKCCLCYFRWRENIMKYFTEDAYIEVVIYGYPYRTAGRQAFSALTVNALGVRSVKGIGNFVLVFARVLVCTAAVLAGSIILKKEEDLLHIWVILILVGIFAYFISTCFFSVYQTTIDTIFLCFCEDYNNRDGLSKPYLMSKELLELVENTRKLLGVLDEHIRKRRMQPWT